MEDSGSLSTLPPADNSLEPQGGWCLVQRSLVERATLSIPGPHTVLETDWCRLCSLSLDLQGTLLRPPSSRPPSSWPLFSWPSHPALERGHSHLPEKTRGQLIASQGRSNMQLRGLPTDHNIVTSNDVKVRLCFFMSFQLFVSVEEQHALGPVVPRPDDNSWA